MNDLQTEATHDQRKTVVLRLRELQKHWDQSVWLHGKDYLAQLAGDAADMIEWYSEGKVPADWKRKGPK